MHWSLTEPSAPRFFLTGLASARALFAWSTSRRAVASSTFVTRDVVVARVLHLFARRGLPHAPVASQGQLGGAAPGVRVAIYRRVGRVVNGVAARAA